jgi:hypothetical protein
VEKEFFVNRISRKRLWNRECGRLQGAQAKGLSLSQAREPRRKRVKTPALEPPADALRRAFPKGSNGAL